METLLATVVCSAAIASCAERLVRARDVRWALLPLAAALAAWIWLWSLRLPPTPGSALLAFTIADLGVLAIGVVGVMRLLGGFDETPWQQPGDGDDEGDDDPAPLEPWDPPPSSMRPLARHHVAPRNRRRQDHRRRRSTEV